MDTIIVLYDPFNMESRIDILKDGQTKYTVAATNISDLAQQLVSLAVQENIYNIKTYAASEPVLTELKTQVQDVENRTYSTNKITIEEL